MKTLSSTESGAEKMFKKPLLSNWMIYHIYVHLYKGYVVNSGLMNQEWNDL